MRELETEQQLPLVLRNASGIRFTEYGKALLIHARLVVDQLHRAQTELAQFRGEGKITLRIGITPWVILTFLPETVTRFRQKMPEVQLEIFEGLMGVSQSRLRDGDMDFVVGPYLNGMMSQEFANEVLLSFQSWVAVWRGHPLQNCSSIHDLLEHDWVVNYTEDGRDAFMHHLFWQHDARIDETRLIRAYSLGLLQILVEQAGMIGYCPGPILTTSPLRERMVVLPLKEQFQPVKLGIVMRRDHTVSSAAQCFIDCLLSVIRHHFRSAKSEDRLLCDSLELLI
ncbi:MAG: LysR substrate-binding domain-containing protein [Collimonas pratensis]|uniref:LysR substrate-binding domain-containing protein n=1 Tax=Collimonas pratensis TaxID=279113 RepID=UPI003C7395F5